MANSRIRSSTQKPSSVLRRLLCCTPGSTSPVLSPFEQNSVRPHFIPVECLWLPNEIPYDNQPDGFWDFPERAGWILDGTREYRTFPSPVADTLGPILKELDEKYKCRQRTVPRYLVTSRPADSLRIKCFRSDESRASLSDEVAFIQAWLFWGVYAQANAITGVPSNPADDFAVKTHADGVNKMLSTAVLDVLPHRWASALNGLSEVHRAPRRKQLLEVVQHAVSLQTATSTVRPDPKLKARTLTYDECKVLLSIRLLFRAILLALALSVPSPLSEASSDLAALELLMDPVLAQSFPACWDELKDFATDEMRANGWCASECQLLERYDGAYNFFALHLRQGRWPMDHGRCTDWVCMADQVDEGVYETVHAEAGCQCALVQVRPEELCAVLDRGKVPRIVLSKDLKVTVSDREPYFAISHVWAHGLGNPKENALPRCQVQRLVNYMSGLRTAGDSSVALWMDTLCIPVHENFKSYRKKAITLMSQTYRDASSVLVLDRELQRLDTSTVSLLEQDILTAFVSWTRRLWTLQEAALANRLYIQTLHAPHQLETGNFVLPSRDRLLAQICFREDIVTFARSRIPPMATLKQTDFETSAPTFSSFPIVTSSTAYQRLALAVQHRTTSKLEDEPIILAITLGLPLSTIQDAPNRDARMAALLILLRDVPADIVFEGAWPGERCKHAPFRWAPLSLLGFPRPEVRMATFGPGAVCDEKGLHACYEGLLVDAGAGGERVLTAERWYAVDRASGMKYEFQPHADPRADGGGLPERVALLFRAYGIGGDTAVASVVQKGKEKGQDEIEVTVVEHWVMVASGAGLECTEGVPILGGRLTASDQRWCVT